MPPGDSRRKNQFIQKRTYLRPTTTNGGSSARQQAAQDAAVGVVRNQIETIFQKNNPATETPSENQEEITEAEQERIERAEDFAETSHSSPDSPYDRTHEADRTDLKSDQWKHYHSAWQDYYQQYYERYYLGEVYRMRQTLDTHTSPSTNARPAHEELSGSLSEKDVAFHNLRADLLQNVRESAVKVQGSRHFAPIAAGLFTLVLFWFFIAGGNQRVFASIEAYASPGDINPANIITDPNLSVPVDNQPRLIIPKINVDVPVVYDVRPDQDSQLRAMEGGVAWFGIPGANSRPGQIGNTVLSGHSSNDLFDPGNYKFIFARLEQLTEGDTFYVNYLGKRYTYSITKKEVVKPTDVQKLVYDTDDKPVMTLITCVPLGTAQNRLLVTAEQISPNPLQAQEAPVKTASQEDAAMPGNAPNLLQRLFGG